MMSQTEQEGIENSTIARSSLESLAHTILYRGRQCRRRRGIWLQVPAVECGEGKTFGSLDSEDLAWSLTGRTRRAWGPLRRRLVCCAAVQRRWAPEQACHREMGKARCRLCRTMQFQRRDVEWGKCYRCRLHVHQSFQQWDEHLRSEKFGLVARKLFAIINRVLRDSRLCSVG